MGFSFRSDDDFLFQIYIEEKKQQGKERCPFFTMKIMKYGPKCLALTWTNQLTLLEVRKELEKQSQCRSVTGLAAGGHNYRI